MKRNYLLIAQIGHSRRKKHTLGYTDVMWLVDKLTGTINNISGAYSKRAFITDDGAAIGIFITCSITAKQILNILHNPSSLGAYRKEIRPNEYGLDSRDSFMILELGADHHCHNIDHDSHVWLQLLPKAASSNPDTVRSKSDDLATLDKELAD